MTFFLALVIGGVVGFLTASQVLRFDQPQNLAIAAVVGAVAGALASSLFAGLLSMLLVIIGQVAVVGVGAYFAVWGLKQFQILK
jgi:hypothetical protein